MSAVHPCWPDCVNDVLSVEVKGIRAGGLSRSNLTDLFALLQQLLLTGSSVNCAVGSATNARFGICCIDDGIRKDNFQFDDLMLDK